MPGNSCCVPHCGENARKNMKRPRPEDKVSFHPFPKSEQLRKEWIVKIRRDPGPNFVLTKHTMVCGRHFKKEDRVWSAGRMCYRRLKKGAVPTVFAWSEDSRPARVNVKDRIREEEAKHLIEKHKLRVHQHVSTSGFDEETRQAGHLDTHPRLTECPVTHPPPKNLSVVPSNPLTKVPSPIVASTGAAQGAAKRDKVDNLSSRSGEKEGNQETHGHSDHDNPFTGCLVKPEHGIVVSSYGSVVATVEMAGGADVTAIIVNNGYGQEAINVEGPLIIKAENIETTNTYTEEPMVIKSELIEDCGQETSNTDEPMTIKSEVFEDYGQGITTTEEPMAIKSEVIEDYGQGTTTTEEPIAIKSEVIEGYGQGTTTTEEPMAIKSEVIEDYGQAIATAEEHITIKSQAIEYCGLETTTTKEEPAIIQSEMIWNCGESTL